MHVRAWAGRLRVAAVCLPFWACSRANGASVPAGASTQPVSATQPAPQATPATPEPDPAQARLTQFLVQARRLQSLSGRELGEELAAFEQSADSISYAMLKRNADRHSGRNAVYSGRVLEIQDMPDGGTFLRLGMGEYGENVLAIVTPIRPADDIVERTRVRVYGTLTGSYTYQSQAGWTITIPSMLAVAVVARR